MTWNTFWNFKAEAFYMLLSHFRAKPHTPAASGLICTCVYEEQTVLFEVKVHRRGQKAKGSEWLHRNTGDNSRSLPFFWLTFRSNHKQANYLPKDLSGFWFLNSKDSHITHTRTDTYTHIHTHAYCVISVMNREQTSASPLRPFLTWVGLNSILCLD